MKTRILHSKFWKDSFVSTLSSDEKLLFVYLILNEHVNILHLYECSDREIMFDTGLDTKALQKAKETLQKAGKVYFFDGYVFLRNAHKYEEYNGPLHDKARDKILKELSEGVRKWYSSILEGSLKESSNPLEGSPKGTEIIIHNTEYINHKEGGVGETIYKSASYLQNIPNTDVYEFTQQFKVNEYQLRKKGRELFDWAKGSGKRYSDYKAVLRNAIRKDYGEKEEVTEKKKVPFTGFGGTP